MSGPALSSPPSVDVTVSHPWPRVGFSGTRPPPATYSMQVHSYPLIVGQVTPLDRQMPEECLHSPYVTDKGRYGSLLIAPGSGRRRSH